MSNYAFVVDTDKQPQNPVHPAHARNLLSQGKAAVYRKYPFTIILKEAIAEGEFKPLEIKIDPGSKTTGIAILEGNNVIWGAELYHRGHAIKRSLDSRRSIRHNRRSRKTRYRPARFLNRTKPKGWLAPSLLHRVLTTETWVKRLIKVAPIVKITQELVRFDLQKQENPEISGVEYQQGTLVGYEVREYLLEKWNRQCTYCGEKDIPLQVEHIHPRAKGGTNRISNLCLACESCNQEKGTQNIKDFLVGKPDILKRVLGQAKRPLKDAAAVNSTRWALLNQLKKIGLPVSTGSGGLTKFNRTRLSLPKAHWIDASCVGLISTLRILTKQPLLIKATGHGTRQRCRLDKYGFPVGHAPKEKFYRGFQTGDIVKAVIPKGKFAGHFIGRIAIRFRPSFVLQLSNKKFDVHPKYLTTIHRNDGFYYSLR